MFSTEVIFQVGMAFQIDLPILVLREAGVVADGILEKGSSAFYLPTFDLKQGAEPYLESDEWQHIYHRWSLQVQAHSKSKDIHPASYEDLPQIWSWARIDRTTATSTSSYPDDIPSSRRTTTPTKAKPPVKNRMDHISR